ncbi:MAG: hypothetical protein U0271_10205 [Polyangiaceae bacterium]
MVLDDAAAEIWRGPTGQVAVWMLAPQVIVTRVDGNIQMEGLRFYTSRADRLILREGRLHVFHHWGGVTTWESDVRDELRHWAKGHEGRLVGTHFLVRSRVLSMAIEVAALALGRKLHAHRSEATFFAELENVLGKRASVPPPAPHAPAGIPRITSRSGLKPRS